MDILRDRRYLKLGTWPIVVLTASYEKPQNQFELIVFFKDLEKGGNVDLT